LNEVMRKRVRGSDVVWDWTLRRGVFRLGRMTADLIGQMSCIASGINLGNNSTNSHGLDCSAPCPPLPMQICHFIPRNPGRLAVSCQCSGGLPPSTTFEAAYQVAADQARPFARASPFRMAEQLQPESHLHYAMPDLGSSANVPYCYHNTTTTFRRNSFHNDGN
jgi:hypothetical protein